MFRFSYKWVAGVEFGMSALLRTLGLRRDVMAARALRALEWLPGSVAIALIAVPSSFLFR